MTIEASDQEAGVHARAPRVTLADMEAKIVGRYDTTALRAIGDAPATPDAFTSLAILSICILVMNNGFTVVGTSAPASPANFDAAFGAKLAYEHAIRQLWPLEGYALRDRLAAQ